MTDEYDEGNPEFYPPKKQKEYDPDAARDEEQDK